ncbi:hypothetical protein ACH4D5_34100 [Streptomyces sp. NPDC018029]|uniref:hypothetical protein n=1 Tax=Streptomyces sp. NPDC018029 TaxID=3365032 RepID=UPI00378D7EFA
MELDRRGAVRLFKVMTEHEEKNSAAITFMMSPPKVRRSTKAARKPAPTPTTSSPPIPSGVVQLPTEQLPWTQSSCRWRARAEW